MKSSAFLAVAAAFSLAAVPGLALAQQAGEPFYVGNPLGLPVTPSDDAAFEPMSSNVKVYGAIYSAESCSYDEARDLIVVPNRAAPQRVQTNNGWVSFINH